MKPLLLLLLEGSTDRKSLYPAIARNLSFCDVQPLGTHGDILMRDGMTVERIVSEVVKEVESFLLNNPYRQEQPLEIAHIIDSDAVFADGPKHEKLLLKAQMLPKLIDLTHLPLNVPPRGDNVYRIYFMSRNLEHVLHDRGERLDPAEKDILAKKYQLRAQKNVGTIINDLAESAIEGGWLEAWECLRQGNRSAERGNNLIYLLRKNRHRIRGWRPEWDPKE